MATFDFTSHSTGEQHQLKSASICKTTNVIYLIQLCKRCGQQYIGETGQALHCKMNNHQTDIIQKETENKHIAVYFNTPGHSMDELSVVVIEKLWKNDPVYCKIRKNTWIGILDTFYPRGMNLSTDTFWRSDLSPYHPLAFELYPHLCINKALVSMLCVVTPDKGFIAEMLYTYIFSTSLGRYNAVWSIFIKFTFSSYSSIKWGDFKSSTGTYSL